MNGNTKLFIFILSLTWCICNEK